MADFADEPENEQNILTKHRKEKKDLQAKIQALKKTASKGDKKKRKEVLEEIAKLEIDLEKKQTDELNGAVEAQSQAANNIVEEDANKKCEDDGSETKQKISKAQKRRDKKARDMKQREEEIANYKVSDDDPRLCEMKQLKELLTTRGLCLYPIASDGNCLYNAVKHQLEVTDRPVHDISHLRHETANYILNNKDFLICYMTNPKTGNLLTDEEFYEYCDSVRNTAAWGGQIEIKALSNVLKVPIEVIQANSPPTLQGEGDFKGPNLVITYHRYMYSLGEHYNSTLPATKEELPSQDEFENQTNANVET